MTRHDEPPIISQRDAIKKVFKAPLAGTSDEAYKLSISNVHTWTAESVFVPCQRAKPRDKAGSKLSKSDLVYLSVLRHIFRVGVKFTSLGPLTSFHFRKGDLSHEEDARLEAARAQGRGPQTYFELRNYGVFLHIRPVAIGAKFMIFDQLGDLRFEFDRATALKFNNRLNLEPHIFINILAHSEYIDLRLRAIGLA